MGEVTKSNKSTVKAETQVKEKKKIKKTEPNSASESSTKDKTREKSPDKPIETPKSASQRSISHFSSVTSKEYRSGWSNIFGKKNK
jgi:hypothetical protein